MEYLRLIRETVASHLWWLFGFIGVAGVIITAIQAGIAWALGLALLIVVLFWIAALVELRKRPRTDVAEDGGDKVTEAVPHHERGAVEEQTEGPQLQDDEADEEIESELEEEEEEGSLFSAIRDRDPDRVREIMTPEIEDEADPGKREVIRSRSLVFQVYAGSAAALTELEALADSNPQSGGVVVNLGHALNYLGEPGRAATELDKRKANTSDHREDVVELEAITLRRMGRAHEAISIVEECLPDFTDTTVRARLYGQLGKSFAKVGQSMEAARAYERALELDPSRQSTRFSLAYLYSQNGLEVVAIHHYLVLIRSGNATPMALNNCGVDYAKVGMELRSKQLLKRAVGEGSPDNSGSQLAAGNLAHSLLGKGFTEEALGWVDQVDEDPDAPARLTSVRSTISSIREKEEKRQEELDRAGNEIRSIIKDLPSSPSEVPSGDWSINHQEVHFDPDAGATSTEIEIDGKKSSLKVQLDEGMLSAELRVGEWWATRYRGFGHCTEQRFRAVVVSTEDRTDWRLLEGQALP